MSVFVPFPQRPVRAVVIYQDGDGAFLARVRDGSRYTSTSRRMTLAAARGAALDMAARTGLPVVLGSRSDTEQPTSRWCFQGDAA